MRAPVEVLVGIVYGLLTGIMCTYVPPQQHASKQFHRKHHSSIKKPVVNNDIIQVNDKVIINSDIIQVNHVILDNNNFCVCDLGITSIGQGSHSANIHLTMICLLMYYAHGCHVLCTYMKHIDLSAKYTSSSSFKSAI